MTGSVADTDGTAKAGPAISLVLPVYNGERYLPAALDSIFAQTFRDFELIAVDDCSTDGTARILADYASRHPNMTVITNPANAKLPASLNNGFRAARGEWLSWTSDDNTLDPDTLDRMYAAARSGEADILYGGFRLIDEDGRVVGHLKAAPIREIVIGNPIGCCFLYHRDVDAALGGYDETLFGVEDYDFWLRAHQRGFRFQPVDAELYSYRRHGGSLTATRARQIHNLSGPRMLAATEQLPASSWRAYAFLKLATRDPYTLNWHLLARSFRDDPKVIFQNAHDVLAWLRYAVRVRIG